MSVGGFGVKGQGIITDGMVLCLDAANRKSFVSGSTSWYDLSGGGNTGTLTNGPAYNSANGGSIVFDGTNQYVTYGNILNNGILAGTNNKFSWGAWVNKSSNTTTGPIFNKNADGGLSVNERQMGFNFRNSKIDFVVLGDPLAATWYRGYITTNTFSTNQWYYVFATYDGSINTNDGLDRFKIYVNGTLENIVFYVGGGTLTNTIQGSIAPLSMGTAVASNGNIGYPFVGKVSAGYIYNRVLSADEILQNYNSLKFRYQ
jgi:hypothetical protein